ncbi:tRNA-modifying protein YgfZ [Thalassotalea sp. LPB0316]|uniref:tRNA-modifying protein YgfZ n=1 Tax=Thalassotalea sp. LPB0316 TaxID=2769490 RepID=UPI0018671656|nr:tRNA-modifying protein YgfZ [Thalassotalea sp. LPB0316]QOL25591.1 tRNA-modifying protein YgfZ [Thalassotalea sp. LPB0316]
MTQVLPSLEQLPEVFSLNLSQLGAIRLAGEENSHYLQGQVTCDVLSLPESKLLTGAHCNAKGKVFSVFRLFNLGDSHLLLQPKTTLEASLKELQKFGVFAKVDISQASELNFYAIAGEKSGTAIGKLVSTLPDSLTPVVEENDISVLYIAGQIPRYVIATNKAFNEVIDTNIPELDASVWQLLEITDGFPHLSENHIDQYVPQMLNLQAIGAISFTKGCYLGQETVARMQYLGKNKRALFSLTGQSSETLAELKQLEQQLGENWRKAGDVLAYYQADNGAIYLQAVLASDIAADTALRAKEQESLSLTIKPLPYSTDINK